MNAENRNDDSAAVIPAGDGGGDAANGEVVQQQQQQQPRQFSIVQFVRGLVINGLIIYFVSSLFRRGQTPTSGTGGGGTTDLAMRLPAENLFQNGTVFDMYVYTSESELFDEYDDPQCLLWSKEGLIYGDWYGGPNGDGTYSVDGLQVVVSRNVQTNGTLYVHIYLVTSGRSPNPRAKDGLYSKRHTIHKHKLLNRYKRKKYLKTHNLLTGETTATPEDVLKAETRVEEIVSHWHPNLTINIIDDHTAWVKGSVPAPLDEYIEFDDMMGKYYPVVYVNDYWNFVRDYQPINDTTKVLNLTLTYQPLSLFRWQLYTAQNMRSKWTSSMLGDGGADDADDDQDYIKEAFLETNTYLLGITIAVSVLHSIFEFMAFKNDIQFWNNRKSLEGLSVRSVFFNVFQSLIVLLYVLDNETNTIVRVSVFVGLAIEIWKINKVVNIEVDRESKIMGVVPRIRFSDKGSYASSTREYDRMAFRYLSWALYPLLIGYAVYSLLYLEHKGWYSWVLGMLYGFLLTFGFIMMTPQLFINYKLKSVAHLPWRMMTYKALNTFIDDIFAFVIKMPTMYRLGCFRDDIVFFIYLYQRWIYRVDPKRVNEFGTSGEMEMPSAAVNGDASSVVKSPDIKKNE